MLEGYILDHLTSTHIGRHAVKPLLLTIQHPDTCGCIEFMTAESKEVAIHLSDIDGHMRRTLSAIHQHGHLMSMCHANNLFHRIDRPQDIAHMGHTQETGTLIEQAFQGIQREISLIIHGYHTNTYALSGLQQLPGHDVAVMLHLGHYHLISLMHECLSETAGHQIDALGGTTGKEDF